MALNYKKTALTTIGMAIVIFMVYSTLTPTDFRALLTDECPEYQEGCYVVIAYNDTDRLEMLTWGADDYLRWLFHRDYFRLYDGRFIAVTTDWTVEYYRTYGEDKWIKLVRKPSKIFIEYESLPDKIIVTKTTPYYAYNYASGNGGTLVETFSVDALSKYQNFPTNYSVNWIPTDKRTKYLHRLTWRLKDLEPVENSPDGIIDLEKEEAVFGHKVKVSWKGLSDLITQGFYDRSTERMYLFFKPARGAQLLNVRAYDPEWYSFDGDMVYVNTSKAWLSASPHTLSSSGWVTFNLTSKTFSGDIDVVWGFNTSLVKPKKALLKRDVPLLVEWNTSHSRDFFNVSSIEETTEGCIVGNEYNQFKRVVNHSGYDDMFNETVFVSEVVCFDSYVNHTGGNYTVYWNTSHSRTDFYRDVSDKFESIEYEYGGNNKWWFVRNVGVVAGTSEELNVWIDVPFSGFGGSSGKYWFAVKPSSESIQEAVSNNHFYALDPWWNSSWNKRQEANLTVAGGSTPQNYQVLLNVTYDSDMQNDFDDLRFVDNDDSTLLDAWLEYKSDGVWATVWVEVNDSIGTGNTTIYMYYNNGGASSYWNGTDTFQFFDDFEDGSLNAWSSDGNWVVNDTRVFSGSYSASCIGATGDGQISRTMNITDNSIVHVAINPDASDSSGTPYHGYPGIHMGDTGGMYNLVFYQSNIKYYQGSYSSWPSNSTFAKDNWYVMDLAFNFTSTKQRAWKNDSYMGEINLKTGAGTNVNNVTAITFASGLTFASYNVYLDNVYVRKWCDPEPTATFEGAGGNSGCSITINNASSFTNDTTPTINYTAACYDAPTYCRLSINGTAYGDNSTSIANASSNYITANATLANNYFSITVNCTNGTVTNSSSAYTVTVDSLAPSVSITNPTNISYPSQQVLNFTYTENYTSTCWYREDGGSNTTIGYVNGTSLSASAACHHIELWCNDSATNIGTDDVWYTLNELAATTTTLYLNGTSADRYYELGTIANITASTSVSGLPINLSIDVAGLGDNFTYGNSPLEYLWTTHAGVRAFNDSTLAKNASFIADAENITIGYLEFHAEDYLINASVNLTGFLHDGEYPSDVKLWVNDTLLASIPGELQEDTQEKSEWNDTSTGVNLTGDYGGETETFYVKLHPDANIEGGVVELTGYALENITLYDVWNNGKYYSKDLSHNDSHVMRLVWTASSGDTSEINVWNWDGTDTGESHTLTPGDSLEDARGLAWNGTHYFIFYDSGGSKVQIIDDDFSDMTGTNCELNSGNDAPRGATFNSTHLFVLDNDETVYVYDDSCSGGWLDNATTFSVSATMEGDDPIGIAFDDTGSDYILIASTTSLAADWIDEYNEAGTATGEEWADIDEIDGILVNTTFGRRVYSMWVHRTYVYEIDMYPYDITLDVGGDGDSEWSHSGTSGFSDSDNVTSDFVSEITSFLAGCNPDATGYCDLPMILSVGSGGIINMNDLNITINFTFNPVTLTTSALQSYLDNSSGWVDIPIVVESATNGTAQMNDIKVYKYGSYNATVTAYYEGNATYDPSSDSQVVRVVFSNFTLTDAWDWLAWYPTSGTQAYVEPYGQEEYTPFWNASSNAYDKAFDVSITLNETLDDGDYPGTINGNPTWVEGKWGNALDFDGVSDWVDFDNTAGLINTKTDDFSFMLWFKHDGWLNQSDSIKIECLFGTQCSYGGGFRIALRHAYCNGGLRYRVVSNAPSGALCIGTWLNDSQWHHVAIVSDTSGYHDNVVIGYLDGVEYGRVSDMPYTVEATTANLWLGQNSATQAWNGSVDDVRVYLRALTATEVASAYAGGLSRADALASWKLDENTGTTAYDSGCVSNITVSQTSDYADGKVVSIGGTTFGSGIFKDDGTFSGETFYDATTTNLSSSWVTGKYGSALEFDGSNSHPYVKTDDAYNVSADEFTFMAWVKTDGSCTAVLVDASDTNYDPDFTASGKYVNADPANGSGWLAREDITMPEADHYYTFYSFLKVGNTSSSEDIVRFEVINSDDGSVFWNVTKQADDYTNSSYEHGGLWNSNIYVNTTNVEVRTWFINGTHNSNISCEKVGWTSYRYVAVKSGSIYIFINGGNLRHNFYNDTSSDSYSRGNVPVDTWNHIAVTYNDGVAKHYVNGVLKSTRNALGGDLKDNTKDWYIGTIEGYDAQEFAGLIDGVRSYDRALPLAEIQDIYENNTLTRENLSIYYRFDENTGTAVYDTHHISTSDNYLGQVDGNALSFDGVNDYATISDEDSFDFTTAMSFSGWVKLNELGQYQEILRKTGAYRYFPRIESNNRIMVRLDFDDATDTGELENDDARITDYNWHHIGITFSSSTGEVEIYLDGVSKHNYTGYTGKVINVNTNYVILGGGSYLNGSLDDIRIYNRDLSSTEMNTLYSDPDTFLTEGLVGHWKFDEAHGTTFGDYENQYYWVWLNLDGCTGGQFFEPPFNFDSCCSDCVSCWDG